MTRVAITPQQPVVIVGAGPVGLTLAWRLTLAGLPVRVLESDADITDQLRASTFHPPTLDMFAPSGITQTLHAHGQVTPTWQIRLHPSGERAEFDLGVLAQDTDHPYRLQCRQAVLSRALHARLPAEVCEFGQMVTALHADADGVTVVTAQAEHRAALVVGCDGARSVVREAMQATFDGQTYPETTILATTHFAFEEHLQGLSGVNYIWKPVGTFSLLRLPDVWRVSLYPLPGQSAEEAMTPAAIAAQMQEILGEGVQVPIVEKRVYRVHRRVASGYWRDRLVLAGDAAHLNSPKGGMGMNGGIHDAWNLADKLVQVANGAPLNTLQQYERQRRPIAVEDIGGQAHANRQRMMDASTQDKRQQLLELQRVAADPQKARPFLLRSSMIEGLRRAQALA